MDVVHRFPGAQSPTAPADGQKANKALEDLSYIRRCLENAEAFTGVPGLGAILVGASAILATFIAAAQTTHDGGVRVWIAEAFIALFLGLSLMVRKSRRAGASLARGPGRRFGLSLLPAAIAAAKQEGRPVVFTGSSKGGKWTAPAGDGLVARLISDAGGNYAFDAARADALGPEAAIVRDLRRELEEHGGRAALAEPCRARQPDDRGWCRRK